ncbi:MAG: tellurium resistance protein TerC [Planctomycetes bacterium]|nr:tellurium resistance protein TerC [Planctomycetota bacterium]
MLILLQAVLGFDNLLYISMESKRVVESERQRVRRLGIGIAIVLRILLLFVLTQAIGYFQEAFVHVDTFAIRFALSGHALIVLVGGGFILYTAVKEIFHMLAPVDLEEREAAATQRTPAQAVTVIVLMNLVFSFDSILGAIALTKNFVTMAIAVVISGLLMIWLADRVSAFLQKNRMYEVLGLFVLLLVGVMLLSEGGHLAHLEFFEFPIEAMSKSTFYFVIAVLVVVDVVQGRYQKKLLAERNNRSMEIET